jgi:hypothetical protein
MRIVTPKGSVIQRYPLTGVGKRVGNRLYLHADYALEAIARIKAKNPSVGLRMELALNMRIKEFPAFQFCCLRLDLKDGMVRFDEAPDFDTAREPHVGKWLLVCHDGYARRGVSQAIWHHKHLWVKDEYQGCNVQAAQAWSATFLPLIAGVPRASDRTWRLQLKNAGLR